MEETTAILLVFSRCTSRVHEAEWSAWYDDAHLPDQAAAAPFKVATRWEVTPRPMLGQPSIGFSHVTIYELAGDDAAGRIDGLLGADRELRERRRIHPAHCVIGVDVLLSHGVDNHKRTPTDALAGHILAYVLCNDPSRWAEWDRWYDDVHLPDMLRSGAFADGTRWVRRDPAAYGANHVTLYDVVGRSIDEAVEMSAAFMPGLVAAGRKLDCHAGGLTVGLQPAGSHGGAGFRPDSPG